MTNINPSTTFSYSGSMKALFFFALVFFGGGLIVSIAAIFYIKPKMAAFWLLWSLVIVGYFYFSRVSLTAWRKRNSLVTVDDRGISMHTTSRNELIQWQDIIDVKVHWFSKRLTVIDKNDRKIRLEFELNRFSELLKILIDHIPHLTSVAGSLRGLYEQLSSRYSIYR